MDHNDYLLLIYSAFFVCMLIFSFLINGLFLKFSKTLGIRNSSDTVIRWGSLSKPAFGGISFYIIFLLSAASYSIFFANDTLGINKRFIGLLMASSLGFMTGLADDAYNTKPLLKFFAQLLCAFILIQTGTYIEIFSNLYLNYTLTFLWVIGITNSINMLDNMDAITTTTSLVIILSALLILFLNHHFEHIHVIVFIGIISALLGFLYFNWHPSKLYMGDTGSQFLGVILAAIGIIYFWNSSDINGRKIPSKQIIITLLTFMIPIIDTTTVVINRLLKRKSPFVGGKDHTTHHLSYLGLTDSQVAFIFSGLSFISMLFSLFIIKFIEQWSVKHILIFGGYFFLLFALLYYATRLNKNIKDE